jgi:hypothetical protein
VEKSPHFGIGFYLDLSKVVEKSSTSENIAINGYNWKVIVCGAIATKWRDFTATEIDMLNISASTCTS